MSKNNEKLIQMVKKYPILYDSSLPEYKNQFSKNKIWETIGETIDKSGEEARSKWKNLRDTYSKYLKSLKPGESINKSRYGKWQWASSMEFLKDHLAVSSNDNACENEAVDENESNSDQNFTPSPKQKKPHHVEKVIWSINERANKMSSTEHIMIGYAKVLDNLSVQRRIETKMKIAQIIMQAELEEEEERIRQQNPEFSEQSVDPLEESKPKIVFFQKGST